MPRRAVFLGDGENWNTLHQTFTPHAGFLHLIWEAGPIIKCEPLRRELLQKSWDYPFIVMNQKSAPILFVDNPHLGWLKKYKMKPGKRYPVKLPFRFAKHNAIISACNEIDQRGLSHLQSLLALWRWTACTHSLCWVFYQQTMIQCFVVYHKLGFSHIEWSAIREHLGWGRVGGVAAGPGLFCAAGIVLTEPFW